MTSFSSASTKYVDLSHHAFDIWPSNEVRYESEEQLSVQVQMEYSANTMFPGFQFLFFQVFESNKGQRVDVFSSIDKSKYQRRPPINTRLKSIDHSKKWYELTFPLTNEPVKGVLILTSYETWPEGAVIKEIIEHRTLNVFPSKLSGPIDIGKVAVTLQHIERDEHMGYVINVTRHQMAEVVCVALGNPKPVLYLEKLSDHGEFAVSEVTSFSGLYLTHVQYIFPNVTAQFYGDYR